MTNKAHINRYLETSSDELHEVEKVLMGYKVVDSTNLKRLFDSALYLSMISTTFYLFIGYYTHAPIDVLNVSGGFTFILSFLLSSELFRGFPATLLVLWRRNLLRLHNQKSLNSKNLHNINGEYIVRFLRDTQQHLNNRVGILFGFIGFGIAVWVIWLLDQTWILEFSNYARTMPLALSVAAFLRLAMLYSGFVGGVIGWRVFIIGRRISDIGTSFDVDLQVNHPDGCGGLSPIGDLSLKLVYCIVPFLILIGAWLTFVNTLDVGYLYMLPSNIERLVTTLQILIFPLATFSFLCFFFPLTSIHNSMLRAKAVLDAQLDLISKEASLIDAELLTNASKLSPKKRLALEEKVEFLKRAYARFYAIPTWPFKSSHLLRLTSTQIIPVIGIISSVIEFVRNLVK